MTNRYLSLIPLIILSLLVVLVTPVSAEAYTTIMEDENIKISLYYPPEVKIESCYTFTLKVEALKQLIVDELVLTIKLYRDGITETIYSQTILSGKTLSPSDVYSKNIEICIPSPRRPDPYLLAELAVTYTVIIDPSITPDPIALYVKWYMSTVRRYTYNEVLLDLESAKKRIKTLEEKIDNLKSEISKLQDSLDSLSSSYSKLSSSYNSLVNSFNKLQADYEELKKKYGKLEEAYKDVSEEYRKLQIDYEKLRTLYEDLIEDNKQLQSLYNSLREDYQTLLKEYYQLQGVYNNVYERYVDLKSRHEENIELIGQLKSTIQNLKEEVTEKENQLSELNLAYTSLTNENTMTKYILYAESAAIGGIAASLLVLNILRRRGKTVSPPPPIVPSPPPPPPVSEKVNSEMEVKNSTNGKIQKVLSGRRITLPKDVVEKFGIVEGGKVRIECTDEYIKVIPIKEEVQQNQ
ncbi:MAG: hypothetical protein L4877_00170 [Aigarchaeota archaeon]|nr:hypothetical protein [Candidatus Geocrenenecus dongiae]